MIDTTLDGNDVSKMGICGIMSIHIITGIPIEQVYNDYKKMFNEGPKWNGSTRHWNRKKLLTHYGVKYTEIKSPRHTLRIFVQKYCVDGKKYMIRFSGHVITYMNGLVYDQGNINGKTIDEYRRKNSRVLNTLEFE